MAYTVGGAFDKFYENINLSGDHRDTANSRRDHIVALLKKEFDVLDAFASGSIPRFTALRGHADVDVIAVLHYSKHIKDKKPSEVLQAVRDGLGEYKTGVRKSGQAVTLYYETWPNVDIVPVSRTKNDDGSISHYSIPDMNREEWIPSRPRRHSTSIEERSQVCGANFRKAIKMAKWWNHSHSEYLQSYHIEAMALQMFGAAMNDITWDMYRFFKEAAALVQSPLWYEGNYADQYLTTLNRLEAKKRLDTARDVALSAWYATHGANNDDRGAITKWRQVFGDKFPDYG